MGGKLMGKKGEFPNQILEKKINPINEKYLNEYLPILKGQELAPKTQFDYCQALERIFRYKENWNIDFKDYKNSTYEDFRQDLMENGIGQNRINTITAALNKMSSYFVENYPEVFERNFLKNIKRMKDDNSRFPSRALKINELNHLKEFLRNDENYKMEYIFSIIYYSDVKKSELAIFDPKYANMDSGFFEKGNSKVEITSEMRQPLIKAKKMKKLTIYMLTHYFDYLTNFLQEQGYYEEGHSFTFDDIRKTREKYFLKCPCCGKLSENTSDNWVLVKFDYSDVRQIVCTKCKGVSCNEEL